MISAQLVGAGWVAAQRLAAQRGVGGGLDAVLTVLALHPVIPPGVEVVLERRAAIRATVRLGGAPGLLDPAAPGWLGVLAAGDPRPLGAIAAAVDPHAVVAATDDGSFAIEVDPEREPVATPEAVELTRISGAADWAFRDAPATEVRLRPRS